MKKKKSCSMPARNKEMAIKIRKLLIGTLLTLNILMITAMNLCAYSSWLHPQKYPEISYFGLMFPAFLAGTVFFMLVWIFIKKIYMLISLAGMLLCASSIRTFCPINIPREAPAGSIKILSYNVLHFGDRTQDIPLEENPICRYIINSKADIVCMQEAPELTKSEQIKKLFSMYPYTSHEIVNNTILLCLSKYPILNAEPIVFNSSANGSMKYDILIDNDTVMVLNNHLESYKLNDEDKKSYKEMIKDPEKKNIKSGYRKLSEKLATADSLRSLQADTLQSIIKNSKRKYIIACGDFNDASISYVHRTMTQTLNDAYTMSGNGPGLSYNRSGMYFKIDNIFISDSWTPYGAKVDSSIKDSDHYPIYCYLHKR